MMHILYASPTFARRRAGYLLRALYAAILLLGMWLYLAINGLVDGGYVERAVLPITEYGHIRTVATVLSGRLAMPYLMMFVERLLGVALFLGPLGYAAVFVASCFASVVIVPGFFLYNLWRFAARGGSKLTRPFL